MVAQKTVAVRELKNLSKAAGQPTAGYCKYKCGGCCRCCKGKSVRPVKR